MSARHLVVTTCNAEQWDRYGRAMARTFCRHWPSEVPLWLYTEGFDPAGDLPIAKCADLELSSSWLGVFKAKHSSVERHSGRAGTGRYDYRRDAVRFSHKIAAIDAAVQEADCDVLIWMDADTVTHSPVTVEWLEELFPNPAALAWLDRAGPIYPECGFLMFRMPEARDVIEEIVRQYTSGEIFRLPQTHDSYVIQQVVEKAIAKGKIEVASLSGRGRDCIGHPWVNSRLAECMDHLKGARKELGRSRACDVVFPRSEPYWQK